MGERRKAMARTWTRRSHAGGLAAIAAVLLALALALAATTRTNALEVTSSETYYVPVRLRGNLYLVSLTQTSFSYDEGREEEDVEEDVEEEVEQEQEEKDAFEESTDVDLYWLQQQIDLLAQFDSALSLDSVYNQAGRGRPCRHHRRGGRG